MFRKLRIFSQLWSFAITHKKLWLLPMFVVLGLFGLLIVFAQGSAFAPFIYTLF